MNSEVVCKKCGSVDDYRTSNSGPHIRADCNGCGAFIKFLPQHAKQGGSARPSICYTGKYYGKPFSAITDLEWLRWCQANAPMKNTLYRQCFTARINELTAQTAQPNGSVSDHLSARQGFGEPEVL